EKPVQPPGLPVMLGVSWAEPPMRVVHPSPWEQIRTSVRVITSTVEALVTPGSEIKIQHMQGPVGIMRFYYVLFENPDGWRMAPWFSGVLNVNLALLNLLPCPVLDGGHILLAGVEWVRRKPLSLNVLETVQTACAVVIIGLMLYLAFYDVQDV